MSRAYYIEDLFLYSIIPMAFYDSILFNDTVPKIGGNILSSKCSILYNGNIPYTGINNLAYLLNMPLANID